MELFSQEPEFSFFSGLGEAGLLDGNQTLAHILGLPFLVRFGSWYLWNWSLICESSKFLSRGNFDSLVYIRFQICLMTLFSFAWLVAVLTNQLFRWCSCLCYGIFSWPVSLLRKPSSSNCDQGTSHFRGAHGLEDYVRLMSDFEICWSVKGYCSRFFFFFF